MGRKPLSTVAAEQTLTLRMTDHDRALLDALVSARGTELAEMGATEVDVTAASYPRGLIRREAKAKGITVAVPEVAKEPAAPMVPPATNKEAADLHAALLRAIATGDESQASIARRAGIDTGGLSRFVKSGKGLSPEKRKGLAKALK